MNEKSIFTKIIEGTVPCRKIYEDATTLVFMDIQPIQPGQVVVVPKKQVANVWDLPDADYTSLFRTVKKVGEAMRDVFPDKEKVAVMVEGLGVKNHAHVKVFAFSTPEEFHHDATKDQPLSLEELEPLAEKLTVATL